MSLAVMYWVRLVSDPKNEKIRYTFFENYDITWVVDQFTGSVYYFMFPFRGFVEKKLRAAVEDIKNDNLTPELLKMKNKVFGELK